MTAQLITTRFGPLPIEESQIIHCVSPILGFEEHQRYILLDHAPHRPFLWLQSAGNPELSFLLADPALFGLRYAMDVLARYAERDPDQLQMMVIVIIPANPQESPRAHTLGPLWFDLGEPVFGQLVIDGKKADSLLQTVADGVETSGFRNRLRLVSLA